MFHNLKNTFTRQSSSTVIAETSKQRSSLKIHHQHQIIWTSLLTPGLSENSDTTYITCLMLKGQTFNRFALP